MHNTTDVQTNGMMMIWGCDGVCGGGGDDGGRVLVMVVMTIVVVVTTTVTTTVTKTPFALAEGRTPI